MPSYVKLKWVGEGPLPPTFRDDIFHLTENTPWVRVFTLPGDVVKVQVDEEHLPQYTNPEVISSLKDHGYQLHLGPAQLAKMTVIARNVDDSIFTTLPQRLQEDISIKNHVQVDSIFLNRQRKT